MRRQSRRAPTPGMGHPLHIRPRRDGPRRLEQAFEILLGSPGPGADGIVSTTDEENHHESRHLRPGLDREAGA